MPSHGRPANRAQPAAAARDDDLSPSPIRHWRLSGLRYLRPYPAMEWEMGNGRGSLRPARPGLLDRTPLASKCGSAPWSVSDGKPTCLPGYPAAVHRLGLTHCGTRRSADLLTWLRPVLRIADSQFGAGKVEVDPVLNSVRAETDAATHIRFLLKVIEEFASIDLLCCYMTVAGHNV